MSRRRRRRYFVASDPARRAELDAVAARNAASPEVAALHYLVEDASAAAAAAAVAPRAIVIIVGHRLTFARAIAYADALEENAVVALANADVAFDSPGVATAASTALAAAASTVLALTRHDEGPDGLRLFGGGFRPDAQDCWLWRGPLSPGPDALRALGRLELGRGGADGRIAWELAVRGYDVQNPSRSVVAAHVQAQAPRAWRVAEVRPPYLFLPPATIEAAGHAAFAPTATFDDGTARGHTVLRVGTCDCFACASLRALAREWHRLGLARLQTVACLGPAACRWRPRRADGAPLRSAPQDDVVRGPRPLANRGDDAPRGSSFGETLPRDVVGRAPDARA